MRKHNDTNIRVYTEKRDLIGTEKEIINELRKFCVCETGRFFLDGTLLRFISSDKHTPYVFTKTEENKLLLRRRSKYYMIPGDCGQIDIDSGSSHKFKVEEVCADMWRIDVNKLLKTYNIKIAAKKQHEYN
jgi:hypothetical protein